MGQCKDMLIRALINYTAGGEVLFPKTSEYLLTGWLLSTKYLLCFSTSFTFP